MLLGLLLVATAMALGIYGLVHRGLELLIGMAMVVLVVTGLYVLVNGLGL